MIWTKSKPGKGKADIAELDWIDLVDTVDVQS